MNLAIDVASGEKPIEELVGGAIKSLSLNDDVNLILVGGEKNITRALSKLKYDKKEARPFGQASQSFLKFFT